MRLKIENYLYESRTDSCVSNIQVPSLNGRHCYSQLIGFLCLCIRNKLEPTCTVEMGFISVAQVGGPDWVYISSLALCTFGEEHNTDC